MSGHYCGRQAAGRHAAGRWPPIAAFRGWRLPRGARVIDSARPRTALVPVAAGQGSFKTGQLEASWVAERVKLARLGAGSAWKPEITVPTWQATPANGCV